MADKNLTCKDCGAEFVFTEGEQAFYKEKGFENEPQRCPDCRKAKKAQNNRNKDFRRQYMVYASIFTKKQFIEILQNFKEFY